MSEKSVPSKEDVAAIDAVFQSGSPPACPPGPAVPPAVPQPPAETTGPPKAGTVRPTTPPLRDYVRELGQEFQQQEEESTL